MRPLVISVYAGRKGSGKRNALCIAQLQVSRKDFFETAVTTLPSLSSLGFYDDSGGKNDPFYPARFPPMPEEVERIVRPNYTGRDGLTHTHCAVGTAMTRVTEEEWDSKEKPRCLEIRARIAKGRGGI